MNAREALIKIAVSQRDIDFADENAESWLFPTDREKQEWDRSRRSKATLRGLERLNKPRERSKPRIIAGQAFAGGAGGALLGAIASKLSGNRYSPEVLDRSGKVVSGGWRRALSARKAVPGGAAVLAVLAGLEAASKGGQKRHKGMFQEDLASWQRTRNPKYRRKIVEALMEQDR